ncbi:MAG: VWA domain-containing protein [Planctomycetes bacterium]|nr:VWA domain-containing protein [Planctomycetota bacterium]
MAEESGRYHGFSLRDVTWGYRDVFAQAIEDLFAEGRLGPQQQAVTGKFFELLRQADQSCFDHVLCQFLRALNPANRWIMDLPSLFAEVVDLGGSLAESKLYHGTRFFETLARGGLGETPQQMRDGLGWVRRLRDTDEEPAMAFLAGYAEICRRLRPPELQRYVDVAMQVYHRDAEKGCAFLRGELASCERYILAITQECRLADVTDRLAAMLKALTGEDIDIGDLSGLDSDELLHRGSRTLTIPQHLYLPIRVRSFETAAENRRWFLLCGLASASMLTERSFPIVHGHTECPTCRALAGQGPARVNLFQIVEFIRVLRAARRRWPGARRLIDWGIANELGSVQAGSAEHCLADALDETADAPVLRVLHDAADACVNCFDTARRLNAPWVAEVLAAYPGVADRELRPLGFLSDFLFPVELSTPPDDQLVADLKDAARRAGEADDQPQEANGQDDASGTEGETDGEPGHPAAYIYDEWDVSQNDYRRDWCHVHVRQPEPAGAAVPRGEWLDQAARVRAVFERLKPDLARREKHLAEGDAINIDLLVSHLVDQTLEASPPGRFYEKPLINHRDLAVVILLDASGSTGEQADRQAKVLDVEKQAAVILGEGLAALDDRFAVCGFSSAGRECCEFMPLKDFDERWSAEAVGRLMAVTPRSSTRIGPALRHAGWLLGRQPSRQRLIVLVTDGKPMDQGYDPKTGYAQHDVRMACEENARRDVHTFAITTEANSLADVETMFPRRRFVILPDITRLPRVLPQLYLRLTLA